jgi:hypothetical protein
MIFGRQAPSHTVTGGTGMPSLDRNPQQNAAKIFGLVYLPAFILLVVANFGILQPLIGSVDPAQAAQNALTHATLFRFGASIFLLYSMSVLVVSASLYVILRPVCHYLALLALFGRLVCGLVWLLVAMNLFTALRLLSQTTYASLPPDSLQGLARLYMSGFDQYYVGLLFWSLGAAAGAWLWLESGYVPRLLAIFGILASVWGAGCTIVLFVLPSFQQVVNLWLFDVPLVLFEVVLSLLLLFRGLKGRGSGVDAQTI